MRTNLWLVLAAVVGAGVVAAPAAAVDDQTQVPTVIPVTWLGADGQQIVITGAVQHGAVLALRRMADDPVGRPLPAAAADVAAPVADVTFERTIAADDAGTLTVVWRSAGCASGATCDRWFTRYDGTSGAAAGAPALVAAAPPPLRGLDDGSMLLGAGDDPVSWRGPGGTLRATLPTTAASLAGADVDRAGRLLAIDPAEGLTRTAPGGAADLRDPEPCPGATPEAVGAAPDGGFAVACADSGRVQVARFEEDGSVRWRSTDVDQPDVAGLRHADRVAVTADDTTWVGGRGAPTALLPLPLSPSVHVVGYTAAGLLESEAGYHRSHPSGSQVADLGGGITDLRSVGDEVVFADLQECCRYPNNTTYASSVHGHVLPWRPSVPDCTPLPPDGVEGHAGAHRLDVTVRGCPLPRPSAVPTRYRLDVDWPGGSASASVDASAVPAAVEVDGLPAAQVLHLSITPANALGDGPNASTGATVLPFGSVEGFVVRQVFDLRGAGTDLDLLTNLLAAGATTPALVMQSLIQDGPEAGHVEPVARLYRAAFDRDPDLQGLRYWKDRHHAGVRIAQIAEQFARSSEFRRRYGALDDQGYVALVYRNVLGRAADPPGLAYWTQQLVSGRRTRGGVLAQFSESSEHRRRTAPVVQPLTVAFLMLHRLPTAAERAAWAEVPEPYATLPSTILGRPDYPGGS